MGPHHPIAGTCSVPSAVTLKPISTPLNADAWAQAFCNHPDQAFVAALVDGIRHGFHIGLVPSTACRSSSQNSPSAQEHGDVVGAFIAQQLAAGFMTSPFLPADCSGVITSNLAVVPKKTLANGVSLSNFLGPKMPVIRREFTHVAYSSVEDAALIMHTLGYNSQLVKTDIRDAYRIISINHGNRPFLGIEWQE